MSKRSNDQTGQQRPNSSLRVLFVELNGSDATIEEALRTVERMRRPSEANQPTTKRITASQPIEADQKTSVEPEIPGLSVNSEDELTGRESNEGDVGVSARQKRGQGPKKDRNAGIALVGDLDFVPKSKITLKNFFAEKAPISDMDQILVLCHYLQHTLKLSPFGPGHILSGFRHVGKPVPVDLKATIRNMKKDKAWLSYADVENLRTTTEGDNRVDHELGKGNSAT